MSIWTNTTFDGPDVHIEYDYTCKECGKTFHSAMDVPDFAADIIPRPTLCDQCGERLKQEAEKREKEARKKQKTVDVKEIRFSPNIDTNDLNTKINQARKFLSKGDKVKVNLRFRGRELAHVDASKHILTEFAEALEDCANIDKPAKFEGRSMVMILSKK